MQVCDVNELERDSGFRLGRRHHPKYKSKSGSRALSDLWTTERL